MRKLGLEVGTKDKGTYKTRVQKGGTSGAIPAGSIQFYCQNMFWMMDGVHRKFQVTRLRRYTVHRVTHHTP